MMQTTFEENKIKRQTSDIPTIVLFFLLKKRSWLKVREKFSILVEEIDNSKASIFSSNPVNDVTPLKWIEAATTETTLNLH